MTTSTSWLKAAADCVKLRLAQACPTAEGSEERNRNRPNLSQACFIATNGQLSAEAPPCKYPGVAPEHDTARKGTLHAQPHKMDVVDPNMNSIYSQ